MLISGYNPSMSQAMLGQQMAGIQRGQLSEQEKARRQQLYMGLAEMILKGLPMAAGGIGGAAAGGAGGAMAGMSGMAALMPRRDDEMRRFSWR